MDAVGAGAIRAPEAEAQAMPGSLPGTPAIAVDWAIQAQADTAAAQAFNLSPVGMAVSRMDGTLLACNAAFARLSGRSPEQVLRLRRGRDLLHPADWAAARRGLRDLFSGRRRIHVAEARYVSPAGSVTWVRSSTILVEDGQAQRLFTQVQDISAERIAEERRSRLERELLFQTEHDPLTGLLNRTSFDRSLVDLLAGASGQTAVLLFCDLDGFKVVNDSMGHRVGDAVLVEMAARIRAAVRPGDLVGRFGGDEFLVAGALASRRARAQAVELASRIIAAAREPIVVDGRALLATTSVGIALAGPGRSTSEAMIREADTAMYRAKELGRNRIAVFNAQMSRDADLRMAEQGSLRMAVRERRMLPHYQPIVDLQTGAMVGVEALARWSGPDGTVHVAADFVEAAAATGLLADLGEQVLSQAFAQAARWQKQAQGRFRIAVNVAAQHVASPRFVPWLTGMLAAARLNPQAVVIEITEHSVLNDSLASRAALVRLRRTGVAIAIDDFGSGYSNLGYLGRLPVQQIKVDARLVKRLSPRSDRDRALVEVIVHLGRALGLEVVAEGVETTAQLAALAQIGCRLGQGHALGGPVPADGIDLLLAAPSRLRPPSTTPTGSARAGLDPAPPGADARGTREPILR